MGRRLAKMDYDGTRQEEGAAFRMKEKPSLPTKQLVLFRRECFLTIEETIPTSTKQVVLYSLGVV